MHQHARELLDRGYSVIPVGRNKKPLIKWEKYQKVLPTAKEVETWFKVFPDANIGIVTGAISGLVVVDVEKGGSVDGLPATLIAATGGGGWHYYYKHPGGTIRNSARKIRDLMDIRADGGYVVVSPSTHASGKKYEWQTSFDDLADLPEWLHKELQKEPSKPKNWQEFTNKQNSEGSRNNAAAQYVGHLLHTCPSSQWETIVWAKLKRWNASKNVPPLDEKELRTVFESIVAAEAMKQETDSARKKVAEATQVVQLVEDMGELFHDQYGAPYIHATIGNHKEILSINHRSSQFSDLMNKLHYDVFGKTMSDTRLKEVTGTLRGKAIYEGKPHVLANRMTKVGDDIWLDMCDKKWRAIKINKDGWEIVSNPPILFSRKQHSLPYTEPMTDGDITVLDKYLNLVNSDYSLLIYAFLLTTLITNVSTPCLVVHGQQGSAKTTMLKMLRSILDTSITDVFTFPDDKKELIQTLDHNRVCFFDNLSRLSQKNSDMLCKAVTGFSSSNRKLYTDDDSVIRSIQSVVGVTGINVVATRPDLLERSLIIELAPISPSQRKTERDIWESFQQDMPSIMGGLLDLLVRVLNTLPDVEKKHLKRMSDFTLIGEAMMLSMDKEAGSFIQTYEQNIRDANDAGLEDNKVAQAVVMWMGDMKETTWSGTATELYKQLTSYAKQKSIILDDKISAKQWPSDPASLSTRLVVALPLIRTFGIEIHRTREAEQRLTHIRNLNRHDSHDGTTD